MTLVDRILAKCVAGPNSCIIWTGGADSRGYGMISDGSAKYVHRVICEDEHGPLGKLVARHTCDTPRCCNKKHLIPGTRGDNIRDAFARGQISVKVPADAVEKLRSGELSVAAAAEQFNTTVKYANNIKLGWKR